MVNTYLCHEKKCEKGARVTMKLDFTNIIAKSVDLSKEINYIFIGLWQDYILEFNGNPENNI